MRVQYRFHWGDGQDSGWLGVGVTAASHAWAASNTYSVTLEARSATNPSVVSPFSTPLSVTVVFPTLSINGGSNTAEVAPSTNVSLAFNLYDEANGANDIGWAQFYFADSSGNVHCYGDWGRPNGLDLYDGNTGTTWGFGINQSDSFCNVSLSSITNSGSDPAEVTVVLNFNFNPGPGGTYTALTQVNYVSGYAGPWQAVGTVTIDPGPVTISGQVTAALVGAPGITVTMSGSGSASAVTDVNGNYLLHAAPGGSYTVTPQQGGVYTFSPPSATFSSLSSSVTANFSMATFTEVGSPGPEPAPDPTPTAPPSVGASCSGQDCSDITGTWSDPNLGAPGTGGAVWRISAAGGLLSGSLIGYETGDGTCGPFSISYGVTVSGSGGVFHLNATNPSPSSVYCNGYYYSEPVSIGVDVSPVTCPAATPANYATTWPSGPRSRLIPEVVPPALRQWTRSDAAGAQLTVTLYDTKHDDQDGTISVVLTGPNKVADLTVAIDGPAHTVLSQQSQKGPGTYSGISLQRATLPPGQYGTVTATWGTYSLSLPVVFNVLGPTRFSTYNTSVESSASCVGSATPVFIFVNNLVHGCYGYSGSLKSDFLGYVGVNGSGLSTAYGLLKPWVTTWLHSNKPGVPDPCPVPPLPGLSASNTLVSVTNNTGQCNEPMVPGTTLATWQGPGGQWLQLELRR